MFEKDGFKYDNGPTFFHYPEIAEEIFEALGLDAREELGLIELDPNYRLVFGAGGSIDASTDLNIWSLRLECYVERIMRRGSGSILRTTGRN